MWFKYDAGQESFGSITIRAARAGVRRASVDLQPTKVKSDQLTYVCSAILLVLPIVVSSNAFRRHHVGQVW